MLRSCVGIALVACAVVSTASLASARQQKMVDYHGQNWSVPKEALPDQAQFFDQHLAPVETPGEKDVVAYQDPLPGEVLESRSSAKFVVTGKVSVPELVGMRVTDADKLLTFYGLAISIVDNCDGEAGHAPQADENNQQVTEQCVAPGTVVDPGNVIGVVCGPWPESVGFWIAVTAAAIAAAAALLLLVTRKFPTKS